MSARRIRWQTPKRKRSTPSPPRHRKQCACSRCPPADDGAAASEAFSAFLAGFRADLEAKLLAATPPELARSADVAELAALDNYDRAVAAVVYPHLHDPAAIPLQTRTSVQDATGVADSHDLRTKSAADLAEHETALREWPAIKRDVEQRTPAGAFAAAITVALPATRQAEVGAIGDVVRQRRTTAALAALTRTELDTVAHELGGNTNGLPVDQARSNILTSLGLDPGLDLLGSPSLADVHRLQGKVERNEFDVFMTHHSKDKPAVSQVSEVLRRHGINPWLDDEQIRPGTWFQDAIQSAISNVRTAAVFFGPHGLGHWQLGEIRTFTDRCVAHGLPLIPVVLPGLTALPHELLFLHQLNVVRFEHSVLEETPLRRQIWGITGSPHKPR
jgi:hypothetical protein